MNALLLEVLQYLQNNGYRRASFDRLIGIVPSATTYNQLYALINENPMLFRSATIKGGLPGLAVLDDVCISDVLASHQAPEQEEVMVVPVPSTDLVTKVTKTAVEIEIVNEYYRNAGSAVKAPEGSPLYNVTLCFLQLRNSFVIVGKSACVDSSNFNEDLGRQLAREDAIKQVWPFLGFRLADKRRVV